ncbi:MAG: PAS domain S-box protein [Bacteroidota bacterium]
MKQKPNLLIVDDSEENLLFLEAIIKRIKVNLIQALSGQEALDKTDGVELALAIIDVNMPEMNGYELAVKLNNARPGGKVPIIFLTASHLNEMQVFEGYDSGAVDYIFKPTDNQILVSKVNVFLDLFNQKQTISRNAMLLKETADALTRANAALTKSEEKYRSYINNAPDGVFVANHYGKYVEVNDAACKITGYSKSELLSMSISDILTEESLQAGLDHFREGVNKGISISDLIFKHKNGTKRWWTVEVVKLSDTRYLGFTKDITDRKVMEEALRINQLELETQNEELAFSKLNAEVAFEKYAELYEFAPSGYFTLSLKNEIIELNHSGAQMLGKDRSELLNSYFEIYISEDTLPVFNTFFQNIFKTKVKERCEVMLKAESEGKRYVHIDGVVVGNYKQCLINVVDITERKEAEETVKVSEKKYKTMLNASPDGFLLVDLKRIITEVSDIGLELFGADSREDLVGKDIFQFVPPDENDALNEIFEKTMNEGLAQNIGLKIRKTNQSLFPAESSATLIQGQHGEPISFMIIIRDISQRKKMETKQIHADRMANLGEMASGIAHEINQPLNIISMVMDKILFESAKTDTISLEYLKNKSDKIFENITRIRNIIDHIRAFSRSHDDFVLSTFDINASIENAASMIAEQFKHLGIRLLLNLEEQIPQIIGNTYKFEQVIINLLVNAKDAVMDMKNSKRDEIDMVIGINSYQETKNIIVEVTDNGIGISNEDINNIILPFYTTKDEGKGTGLGLSICYQIIKEMNGTIDISSEPVHGTKIKLVLKAK